MKFDPSMKLASWSPQALISKRCSVDLGYYQDEFIKYFCPKARQHPLESLYYYTRVVGIRNIIEKFMESFKDEKVQFVNLGSGLDTTSLRLLNKFPNVVCYDLDLEFQMKLKVDIILRTKELLDLFPNYKSTESTFTSERYSIFPCNLSNLVELNKLKDFGFSDNLPTIYLNESVFTYIPNELSNKIINFLSNYSSGPSILVYQERGIPYGPFVQWFNQFIDDTNTKMYSHFEYPTIESQVSRYKSLGWSNVYIYNLTYVYNQMIDKRERSRLRKIENFNHMESLGVYLNHFILGVSANRCTDLKNFLKFFDKPNLEEPDPDDELLPYFSTEELEKNFDREYFVDFSKSVLEGTYNTESEESKSFYEKFK